MSTPPLRQAAALGREAEDPFRLLVESVKDYAIFMLDATGHVRSWNLGAERIKGYRTEQIIGRHFSVFYPSDVAATGKCQLELEVASREGRFEEEGWRVRQDGSRFWANVTITALRNPQGGLIGFAKVTQDLSQRRAAEEAERMLVGERAALAERERMQSFQERFLAILGHDLRNPLASLDMGVGVIKQRTTDPTTLRLLERMGASSQRMSRMIEQILDLTRIRLAGGLQLNPQPMHLKEALEPIVNELRGVYPSKKVDLNAEQVSGIWDRDRLQQVFSNLVSNAILHGAANSPVSVDVRVEESVVHVQVHNQGPPIPAELQAELFNPFRRGARDGRTAKTAGLGLGLHISRELVSAHHGSLDVQSDATSGTTFRVTLPRATVTAR